MALGVKVREKDGKQPSTRYFSSRQEKTVAKAVNGTQTPNSGATPWIKSDVLNDLFTLECKTKVKPSDSISIKKEWFEKQAQEQTFMGKPYSAVVFNFGPDEQNYYIIDEYLFQDLLEYLAHKEN